MNKYVILVLINLPIIAVGIIGTIADYKAARTISKRKCIALVAFWLAVGAGLIFAEPLYNTLVRNNLTDSPPMSIFDIVLLTVVVFCLLLITKINEKIVLLNRRLSRIHEKIAIMESQAVDYASASRKVNR